MRYRKDRRCQIVVSDLVKPIPGFDGYYATVAGEIISAKSPVVRAFKPVRRPDGYFQVCISLGNRARHTTKGIHRLVALAFHGPRPKGMQIRHINGDKSDNRAENLRYGTMKENGEDRVRHGRAHHHKLTFKAAPVLFVQWLLS